MKKVIIYRRKGIDYSRTDTNIALWISENLNVDEYKTWNIFDKITYGVHPAQILFYNDKDCNLFKIIFCDLYKITTQKYETN